MMRQLVTKVKIAYIVERYMQIKDMHRLEVEFVTKPRGMLLKS